MARVEMNPSLPQLFRGHNPGRWFLKEDLWAGICSLFSGSLGKVFEFSSCNIPVCAAPCWKSSLKQGRKPTSPLLCSIQLGEGKWRSYRYCRPKHTSSRYLKIMRLAPHSLRRILRGKYSSQCDQRCIRGRTRGSGEHFCTAQTSFGTS